MKMTDVSIKRPVFITMVTFAFLIAGALSIGRLGLDLFPNTSFGFVVVNTVYPGASPTEVEQRVTDKLEEAVSTISGIDKVMSTSRYSFSQVFIQFNLDVDPHRAADEVSEKVSALRHLLPPDIEEPSVLRLDPTAFPIQTWAVQGDRSETALRDYMDDVVRPAIERLDGVATVEIHGAPEREAKVDVDRRKLERHGLTLTQLAELVGSETLDVPSGRLELGAREESVKTAGRPKTVEELGDVVLAALPAGGQLRLRDVAEVSLGVEELRTLSRINGVPSMTFDVQKASGANTVAVAKSVDEAVAALLLSSKSEGVEINKITDSSDFIKTNVDALWEHLIVGGLMAILVIFVFMLDWRSTVISSVALPVSIISTFVFMALFGFTLNIMSMLGLTLAIGILIDDSVVVRENIYRHLEMGKDPVRAASEGTNEIALAVLATTFTILAVFVPVAFTGGIVGKFFREFGITVAVAVFLSMIVSLTLDPMLSTKITHTIDADHKEKMQRTFFIGHLMRFYEGMDAFYLKVLQWTLKHRFLTIGATVAVTISSCGLASFMGQDFMDRPDRGEFSIALELPGGTSLERSVEVAAEVEEILLAHPEFHQVATTVGPNEEVEKITMRVRMSPATERDIALRDIIEELRGELSAMPGLSFYMREAGLGDGNMDEAPVMVIVTGPELDGLGEIARQMTELTATTHGVRDASMTHRPGAIEQQVHLDRRRAADRGVYNQEAAMTLRFALEGIEVGKMTRGEKDVPIWLRLREEDRASLDSVLKLKVPSNNPMVEPGTLVPLEEVTRVEPATSPSTVSRLNRQRQVTITANLFERTLGEVMPELDEKFTALDLPEGYEYSFSGEAERLEETNENMGLAFALGVVFIYLVLASQFESFIHPLTIMMAMPLAGIGAFIGLFVTGQDMSMSSIIGLILLMGIVTKNSILLVDYANQLRDQGMSIVDALLKACPTRLRPILMTSAAIILGMLPAAISTGEGAAFYAPMSIAVIGGVITSTILTLVVVPIFYIWLDRLTIRGRRERREARLAQQAIE